MLCAVAYGEGEIKKLYLDGSGGFIANDMAWHYVDENGESVSTKWIQGSDAYISNWKNASINSAASGGVTMHGLEFGSNGFLGYKENSLLKLGEGGIQVLGTGSLVRWDGNNTCSIVLTGDILTMPGLPKVPAAEKIDVDENGRISGLF